MINIISTCTNSDRITGPQKVFSNLVKGLDKIGYPYVINQDLNSTRRLWIHDNITALRYMHRSKACKVVGPNLFIMPSDIQTGIRFNGATYLHPSPWAVRVWQCAGFDSCSLAAWPVGIDTDEFKPLSLLGARSQILVYHKQRDPEQLKFILNTLQDMKLKYSCVTYGNYSEPEYQELLAKASLIIWHGLHESQGIALQEAMACNAPILVCDVTSLSQAYGGRYQFDPAFFDIPVTSAPYFDDRCGVKIVDLSRLKESIEFMFENLEHFAPRQYVLENLSLEHQAEAFVNLWNCMGLSYDNGLRETISGSRLWKVPAGEKVRQSARRVWKGWERLIN